MYSETFRMYQTHVYDLNSAVWNSSSRVALSNLHLLSANHPSGSPHANQPGVLVFLPPFHNTRVPSAGQADLEIAFWIAKNPDEMGNWVPRAKLGRSKWSLVRPGPRVPLYPPGGCREPERAGHVCHAVPPLTRRWRCRRCFQRPFADKFSSPDTGCFICCLFSARSVCPLYQPFQFLRGLSWKPDHRRDCAL